MFKKIKIMLVIVAVFLVGGCSVLEPLQLKSAKEVARIAVKYCGATDEDFRTTFRAQVNDELKEDRIAVRVDCDAGD